MDQLISAQAIQKILTQMLKKAHNNFIKIQLNLQNLKELQFLSLQSKEMDVNQKLWGKWQILQMAMLKE